MTLYRGIFIFASLLAAFTNLFMGLFVLYINRRKWLNRAYALMAFAFSIWALGQAGYRISSSADTALLYFRAAAPGYCFLGSLFLAFILIFSEREKILEKTVSKVLLWGVPLVPLYLFWQGGLMVEGMVGKGWGFTYLTGRLFWIFAVYLIALMAIGLIVCWMEHRRAKSERKRKQALFIFIGSLIPILFASATDVLLPMNRIYLPEMGTIATAIMAVFIGCAMVKYRLMSAGKFGAAETVVNTIADSVVVVDADMRIISLNSATSQMLGYAERELIGRHIDDIFQEGELMFKGRNLASLIEKGEVRNHDTTYQSKTGEFIPVSFSASAMKDTEGRLLGIVGVARDMRETRKLIYDLLEAKTGLKRINEQLMKANQELKDMNQMKSDFVSSVSHELRTPLTSIKGYTSIILGEKLGSISEEQKLRLEKINKHTDDLTSLVNDLLDISRIESGRMGMKAEKLYLTKVAQDALDIVNIQAKEKAIKVDCVFPEKLDQIWADEGQIERVFLNLLSNAIKFTPRGGKVTVRITNKPEYVQVDVIDTGIGISEKDRERVFDEFYRVDNLENQQNKGTGLGLSLTRHIIEAHKGKIWVASRLDKGSTFSFILPKERRQK